MEEGEEEQAAAEVVDGEEAGEDGEEEEVGEVVEVDGEEGVGVDGEEEVGVDGEVDPGEVALLLGNQGQEANKEVS